MLQRLDKLATAVQGLRHGTNPQRASLAAGVLMAWALALRIIFALVWWIVPLVWAVWRAVFWHPSLTAALIETVMGGERSSCMMRVQYGYWAA